MRLGGPLFEHITVEHLPGEEEYRQAVAYIRGIAADIDVRL
jgi:hypothetical protein